MKTPSLRIGINGFGRIGRAVYRILAGRGIHRIVAINDVNPDVGNLAYLLQYDSIYGRMAGQLKVAGGQLIHDGRAIQVSHAQHIDEAPWLGCDVVIDASGQPDNALRARRLLDRLQLVLVTSASAGADITHVLGASPTTALKGSGQVVSISTCDANACAPVLAALADTFGIDHGFITTLHPWLGYQNLLDGAPPSISYGGPTDEHYVLGRSAIGSLLPKPTSLVACAEQVLPALAGKIEANSFRVPTAIVSGADLTIRLERDATVDDVRACFTDWQARLKTQVLFDLVDQPLASIDYLGREFSASIDTRWLSVTRNRWVKILLWYDNEWGYGARVADAVDLAATISLRDTDRIAANSNQPFVVPARRSSL